VDAVEGVFDMAVADGDVAGDALAAEELAVQAAVVVVFDVLVAMDFRPGDDAPHLIAGDILNPGAPLDCQMFRGAALSEDRERAFLHLKVGDGDVLAVVDGDAGWPAAIELHADEANVLAICNSPLTKSILAELGEF